MIQPRTLKGFRDYLPQAMLPREALMQTAREVYRSYGFAPIDTPALEYLEILAGKGSDETDKQLYKFTDAGGREVGMRFDLTVPLARFSAQYAQELGLPFKRYHIAPVWRGENTQRGRYREFIQCDFDTIGTESVASDIETALVIHDLLTQIGFGGQFTLQVNHRGVLNGVLESLGLLDQSTHVLRAIDKLAKIGPEKVAAEMQSTAGATAEQADKVLAFAALSGTNDQVLEQLAPMVEGSEVGQAGLARLTEVLAGISAAGVDPARVKLDVSIARGLDYYTGMIYETTLAQLPDIGSVASGGRYDNLAQMFTKQRLPGIGASLGLDRLLSAMEELGLLPEVRTPAEVFVPLFNAELLGPLLKLAADLRAAGLKVELYGEPKKLGKQLQYADKRGHRVAVIAGPDEIAAGQCQVKNLSDGSSETVAQSEAAAKITKILSEANAGE
ncbi:histidine--tRNA ligase [Aeoliella mucimassa]|uniref:Histidine--tRNA ligase n=1 Tax=Aeoliella mucimassa TaxID=2527972 RepID=A0A518AIK9_9BACT|nr:histidine--tRNA ligase [Aeoliella mucimassa]QDU54562.1 Histidine--tRNA ligase [Aeoliella mucimassa]